MEVMAFIICVTVFVLSRQWIQHHRRVLLHKERVAAIEKGIALPTAEQEARRTTWNVQRFLLLAGQIWIVLGIATFIVLTAVLSIPSETTRDVPRGIQYIGIAPVGIGLAHLITYWVESQRQ
jgi:hypothetical protein